MSRPFVFSIPPQDLFARDRKNLTEERVEPIKGFFALHLLRCHGFVSDRFHKQLESFIAALEAFKASLDKHIEAIGEHQQATQRGPQPEPQQIVTPEVRLPPAVAAYYEAEQRDRPSAQRWERVKRGIEFLAFAAAVVLAVLTYRTLQQVRRQADSAHEQVAIMRKQLEQSDRAWIKVAMKINHPITFLENGQMSGYFSFTFTNVGKSVATNVRVKADIWLDPLRDSPEAVLKLQRALCNAPAPGAGYTVFPDNDSWSVVLKRFASTSDINSHAVNSGPPQYSKSLAPPVIYGCAQYQIPALPGDHETGFIYVFGTRRKQQQSLPSVWAMGFLAVGKDVPADQLDVHPWIMPGGDYAY